MTKNNPIPPTGAHLRINSSRLMLRAAFRYLADSERSEVERVDIPEYSVIAESLLRDSDKAPRLADRESR